MFKAETYLCHNVSSGGILEPNSLLSRHYHVVAENGHQEVGATEAESLMFI